MVGEGCSGQGCAARAAMGLKTAAENAQSQGKHARVTDMKLDYNLHNVHPEAIMARAGGTMFTRRAVGRLALAGIPFAWARRARAAADSVINGIEIGVSTYSYRDLPHTAGRNNVARVIQALQATGVSKIELNTADTESPAAVSGLPKPQNGGAYGGLQVMLSPEELASVKRANRENLREWRLGAPLSAYASMRERFDEAGISLFAYRVDYDDAFSVPEIGATLAQAKALGVNLISASASLPMAAQLAPIAENAGVTIALRNGDKTSGAIASAADLSKALSISPQFRIALDIGDFTAANEQAVAFIQENSARIHYLILKDRTRNGGRNEEFGDGDTPIRQALTLLKQKRYPMPVFVQYEYLGVGRPEEEVRKCMTFVRGALA